MNTDLGMFTSRARDDCSYVYLIRPGFQYHGCVSIFIVSIKNRQCTLRIPFQYWQ